MTAKEISHIQKALRKKKHDANYYVTKWQKKVKYADELKAWEKQQEAVLRAQQEQEQLRRNGQVRRRGGHAVPADLRLGTS